MAECICFNECAGKLTCAPGTYSPDDTGGGLYDPVTGVREWYQPARGEQSQPGSVARTWADILAHWSDIENDLADRGIDIDTHVLHERTWRWLRTRITDLTNTPGTRLHTALTKGL